MFPNSTRCLWALAVGAWLLVLPALHAADSIVVFNEIHYHPADEFNDTEWVELRNLNGVDVDISGWQMRGGADFDFVEGTVIAGHGFLVVAANPSHASLSGLGALGPFTGQLANGGESLRLENRNGRVMDRVSYGDDGDWPVGPDGSGATLVKRQQVTADARPANWTTSPDVGGSPGASNFPVAGQAPTNHSLIALDSDWTYRDATSAPPADWAQTGFDDSGWSSGAGALYAGSIGGGGPTGPGSLPGGLVGYWNFDGNVVDQSGTGNDGTLVGASYSNDTPGGGAGQSVDFDNTTEHVLVGADASLNSGTFTIAMFIKDRGQASAINRLTSRQGDTAETGIDKHFGTNSLAYNSPASGWKTSGVVPTLNTWQHIAFVADGSNMTIYLDGVAAHGPSAYTASPSGFLHIGNRHNNVEGFNGLLDEVALWNRALAPAEVASLAGASSLPTLETELALGSNAFYFRHEFQYNGVPSRTSLSLLPIIDDGAVVYLNGVEVYRENLPGGAISHATFASAAVSDPAFTNPPPTLSAASLINGSNVLAVRVHQAVAADPDLLFAATLSAIEQPAPPFEETLGLVFNEISASGSAPFQIEIRNAGESAIDLTGYSLSSSAGGSYPLPAQSLSPGQFLALDESALGFVPVDGDRLFLYGPGGAEFVDAREVTNRLRGLHDGQWAYPASASFGSANTFSFSDDIVINEIMYNAPGLSAVSDTPATYQTVTLLPYASTWRYNQSGASLPTGWATAVHPVGGSWQSGAGILAYETSGTAIPIGTTLTNPGSNNPQIITYYFETEFSLSAQQVADSDEIVVNHLIDDGAIFYLNGTEFDRFGMPSGVVSSSTQANRGGESSLVGPVTIPANLLQVGSNRISVEVHQTSTTSSDVVMGLEVIGREQLTPFVPGAPFRNSDEQWIEIYNRGASTVDLGGWEFSDGIQFEFPAGTMLAPDSYLVVAGDLPGFTAKHPTVAVAGEFGGNLSRSGERLRLRDASKNLADEVRFFDGGQWPDLADGGGSSLELRDAGADNNTASAWSASDESDAGSWQTITYRGQGSNQANDPTAYHEFIFGLLDAGTLLIDDISVVEDPDGTARQLIQNGDFESGNTDKWRFLGTHRHTEVVADPDDGGNQVLQVSATGGTEHMSNHAETTFYNGGYVTTNNNQTYEISFRARWMGGSDQLNTRLYFNRLARVHTLPHDDSYGTPGAANSTAAGNIGPTHQDLTHSPAVPEAGEPCVVSVTADDPDGISGLQLRYSVDGGAFSNTAMSAGADGRWSGTVPGQSASSKVQFYIEATDMLAAVEHFPAAGPDSRAVIPWQDGLADLDYGDCQPNNLRVVMTQADADLLHLTTDLMSNDRIGCTVIYNESDITYGAGVRLKGSEHGRNKDVRVGWNVRFPSDQPFLGCHKTIAIDRSGAGNQFSQKEILVKHAINHAGGIPGMFDDLIRVIAPRKPNSSPAVDLASSAMLLKSRYDNEWLDNRFEDGGDGRLFEYELVYHLSGTTGGPEGFKLTQDGGVSGSGVGNLGDDKELYRWHWLIKNNRDADDYSGLITALKAVGQSSGGQFHADTQALLDVDQWLRSNAIQNLFGIGDNYSAGSGHNAIFYQRPSDGKLLFFPWDMDFTFSGGSRATGNGELNKLLTDPANKHAYYGHLRDIIDTTFNTSYMTYWANHYSCFLPTESLTGFLSSISSGASNITAAINSAVPQVTYGITTADGLSTSDSFFTIQGDGWVDVREIHVAGVPDPIDLIWIDDNTWQAQVPVFPGANSVTLEAYDFQGQLVGSDSVSFTGTGTIVPASATNLVVSELMYHPAAPTAAEITAGFTDQDDFEFLELMNISETDTITLTGLDFTRGITYAVIPATIPPGGRALLVRNQAAFQQRYGLGLPVVGEYQLPGGNQLDNAGERLTLVDSVGAVIRDFTYNDKHPWPEAADGDGDSLVLIAPQTNPDHDLAASWRSSVAAGGNPGDSDSLAFTGDPDLDGDQDGLSAFLEHALGSSDAVANLSEIAFFADANGDLGFHYPRNLAADDVIYEIKVSTDLLSWAPPGPEFVFESETVIPGGRSQVEWRVVGAVGTRLFVRLEVRSR